jgi:hypothetical protein
VIPHGRYHPAWLQRGSITRSSHAVAQSPARLATSGRAVAPPRHWNQPNMAPGMARTGRGCQYRLYWSCFGRYRSVGTDHGTVRPWSWRLVARRRFLISQCVSFKFNFDCLNLKLAVFIGIAPKHSKNFLKKIKFCPHPINTPTV